MPAQMMSTMTDQIQEYEEEPEDDGPVQQPRLWQANGWTARVIKNDGDEGWAGW